MKHLSIEVHILWLHYHYYITLSLRVFRTWQIELILESIYLEYCLSIVFLEYCDIIVISIKHSLIELIYC